MSLETTVQELQAQYPGLNIPTNPAEALQYLAAGYASAKSSFEGYQKQIPVPQAYSRGKTVILPKQ